MKPHEVLGTHVRLAQALSRPTLPAYLKFLTQQELISKALDVGEFTTTSVQQSETLWPTADLVGKLIETAEAYPTDVAVTDEQLPDIPFGVAVLDEPLATIDALGREELVHVVSWGLIMIGDSAAPGDAPPIPSFHTVMWNDARRKPDGGAREQIARWRREAPPGAPEPTSEIGWLFPIRSFTFAPGRTIVGPMWAEIPDEYRERDERDGFHPPDLAISTGRCALALFELMNRVPARAEGETGPSVGRSVVKQAVKAKVTPSIRVMAYHSTPRRSPDPGRPTKTRAPVDHHVHVRGHTRMQAYGPGRSLRREIEIEPYSYGPPDPEGYEQPHRIYRVG